MTGIPTIEMYVQASPIVRTLVASTRTLGWRWRTAPGKARLEASANLLPEDPSAANRGEPVHMTVVVEAENGRGRIARSRRTTPEAYAFTAAAAVAAAERVLDDDIEAGFQTPRRVWGPDFAFGIVGVSREDLPDDHA